MSDLETLFKYLNQKNKTRNKIFRNSALENADLEGIDISLMHFKKVNFSKSNFKNSKIIKTVFYYSKMENSNFVNA